jgi:putative tricarboxylic transport membrane protein
MMNSSESGFRPSRSVELIAGTPVGGGQDRPARVLMKIMREHGLLDVPVEVLNVVGKGGGKAWDYLLERPGDAHVLAISSPPLLSNPLVGDAHYDHAQLTPIANLYNEYVVFAVRSDSTIENADDLMRRIGADASTLVVSLATALGTTNHIAYARIAIQAGADVRSLSIRVFDSARYAVADTVAGHSEVTAVSAVSAVPEIKDGKLRSIAVTAPERLGGIFAGTPTFAERGIDCVEGTWRGVIAPAGLSAQESAYWQDLLQAATDTEQWHTELEEQYWLKDFRRAADCITFLDAERESLRAALGQIGLLAAR